MADIHHTLMCDTVITFKQISIKMNYVNVSIYRAVLKSCGSYEFMKLCKTNLKSGSQSKIQNSFIIYVLNV
jgi:hypothetical protein